MIDNKILEENIRLIQNVLCQKNKLQNSEVNALDIITLIKHKQFPLIPSFLSFLNDIKQFQSIISFSDRIQVLITLIKHQRSKSQISTSNSSNIHGPGSDFDYGYMCAHIVGTPVALGSTDLSSVLDTNGIRWVNSTHQIQQIGNINLSGGIGMQVLFGYELANKYFNEINKFLDKYDRQSNKTLIGLFFNVFYKNFLFKYKKELKTNYVSRAFGRILDSYPYDYKQFILYNYKIKHVIFPLQKYDISEEFKTKAMFLLRQNNITFSTQDIEYYVEENIPEKYWI